MKLTKRKVIAEWNHEDEAWLVMWPSGRVEAYANPEAVAREIRRTDAKRIKRGFGIAVTTIEWRNTPAGFKPPETSQRMNWRDPDTEGALR